MAEEIKIFKLTVKRNIKELKDSGYIERIGAKKQIFESKFIVKSVVLISDCRG